MKIGRIIAPKLGSAPSGDARALYDQFILGNTIGITVDLSQNMDSYSPDSLPKVAHIIPSLLDMGLTVHRAYQHEIKINQEVKFDEKGNVRLQGGDSSGIKELTFGFKVAPKKTFKDIPWKPLLPIKMGSVVTLASYRLWADKESPFAGWLQSIDARGCKRPLQGDGELCKCLKGKAKHDAAVQAKAAEHQRYLEREAKRARESSSAPGSKAARKERAGPKGSAWADLVASVASTDDSFVRFENCKHHPYQKCMKGLMCKYLHDGADPVHVNLPCMLPPGRSGFCRGGRNCIYTHDAAL